MDTTLTDPLIGQLLDGRYRIDSRVARGGMATVYRAHDRRLDRIVAVKVMHPALADDEEFVARFIREAQSAARLTHPSVVSVFDQGADAGHVFLVMEYVEGRTLRDHLRERGRLSPAEAVAVAEPVLSALDAAHRAGLVHRDVKPENVLLADDGRVLVADFGLARAIEASSLTATTGLLLGTVAYLAPEQVSTGRASTRTDVYATGVLLVEMLTGETPYAGDTALSVAYRHVHEDIPAPSTRTPGIPAELDDLVVRATRRNPDARPADAGAFLAELRRVRRELHLPTATTDPGIVHHRPQHTLVVPTPPPGPAMPPGLRRPRRRRSGLVALVVVLVLALVAGAAGWWFGSGRYTDTPRLVGLSEAQARTTAAGAGFGWEVRRAFHDTAPIGRVLATDPGPGERIVKGDRIVATVSKGPDLRAIPSVAGMTVAEAGAALRKAGLRVAGQLERRFDDRIPAERVVTTNPEPGRRILHDAPVTLIVSRGVQPVKVPDVTGQKRDDAENRLTAAGFEVTVAEEFSETVDKGRVISQEPRTGERPKGSTIALVVSKGPRLYAVPDVRGMSRPEAVRELRAAGFKARSMDVPDGRGVVISQSPGPGSMERRGTTVTIYVF